VCKRLIDLANAAGGPDNITVIAARFDGDGLSVASQGDEVGHRVFPLNEGGSSTPTSPMEAVTKASRTPTVPVRAVSRTTVPMDEPAAPVSATRRGMGRAIAGVLLVVLLAAAAWFVSHIVRAAPAAPNASAADSVRH
jgi:protein phosphatase